MLQTFERALPPAARRPGLLSPEQVLDLLGCRRGWLATVHDLADCLERPLEQVLHVVSYLTSLGLLNTVRRDDTWFYGRSA
jgi:hypothetical protein